jgi:hypothetical protein
MAIRHATMYFEDDPETGMIDFRCDFFGPIDPTSHSHNIAGQVISWLNERAEEQKNIQTEKGPILDSENTAESAENIEEIRRMASAGEPLIQTPLPKKVY